MMDSVSVKWPVKVNRYNTNPVSILKTRPISVMGSGGESWWKQPCFKVFLFIVLLYNMASYVRIYSEWCMENKNFCYFHEAFFLGGIFLGGIFPDYLKTLF